MSTLRISDVIVSPGVTGFYFDDQQAIKQGRWELDGFTYKGDPVTPGFSRIRQTGESVSVQLILEDGQIASGDCAAVQYSGCGGRDPLFLAGEFIPTIEYVLRKRFVGRRLRSFREMCHELESMTGPRGERLHTAVRYGITQAFLDAAAKAGKCLMVEVAAAEFGLPLNADPVPIFTQSGDDRYINVDRMIMKRAQVLPHGLFNNLAMKVGTKGEKLLEYIGWLSRRVQQLGTEGYRPVFHVDVYGTLGEGFTDRSELVDYLVRLAEAAQPFRLRVEGPVDLGNRSAQIDALADITRRVDEQGRAVDIVADEWCNTLTDIKDFAQAKAGHVIQVKTPDLGGIQNSMEAVLFCAQHGVEAYLGGTCNETDRSAQVCVHAAMAVRPCQMLAKPGMGVDEGFTVVYNEMQRIMAYLRRKEQLREDNRYPVHSNSR